MRITDLFEAPIRDLQLIGDFDKEGTFTKSDRAFLKSPKHLERIRKAFSNIPYVFDLYFLNLHNLDLGDQSHFGPDFKRYMENYSGEITSENLESLFNIVVHSNTRTISCVYLSNANLEKSVNLTPWIIAHRFVHALHDIFTQSRPKTVVSQEIAGFIVDVDSIQDYIRSLWKRPITARSYIKEPSLFSFATMKSARDNNVITSGEFKVELMTQYIINGEISFIPVGPEHNLTYRDKETTEELDKILRAGEIKMNADMKKILDACVGRIFLTI